MKSVSKRVIEINEPQQEQIERVLVFLRSDSAGMRVSHTQEQAEKYVAGLVCYKRKPRFLTPRTIRMLCALIALIVIGVFALFFIV